MALSPIFIENYSFTHFSDSRKFSNKRRIIILSALKRATEMHKSGSGNRSEINTECKSLGRFSSLKFRKNNYRQHLIPMPNWKIRLIFKFLSNFPRWNMQWIWIFVLTSNDAFDFRARTQNRSTQTRISCVKLKQKGNQPLTAFSNGLQRQMYARQKRINWRVDVKDVETTSNENHFIYFQLFRQQFRTEAHLFASCLALKGIPKSNLTNLLFMVTFSLSLTSFFNGKKNHE